MRVNNLLREGFRRAKLCRRLLGHDLKRVPHVKPCSRRLSMSNTSQSVTPPPTRPEVATPYEKGKQILNVCSLFPLW